MTINKKIFFLFFSLFLVLLLFFYLLLKEREDNALLFENILVEKKLLNLENILNSENERLNHITNEYSKNLNEVFENKDITKNISSNLNISYFVIFDKQLNIKYSEVYDVSSKEFLELSDDFFEFIQNSDLKKYIEDKKSLKFITLDYEKLLFSIENIGDNTYVFIARTIDAKLLSKISKSLNSYVSLLPSYKYKKYIHKNFKYDIQRVNKEKLYVNIELKEEATKEKFYLLIRVSRDYFKELSISNKKLLILFFIAFMCFSIVMYIFINKIFVKRLENISKVIKDVSKEKDLVQNIELIYDDEITYLSKKLNQMFETIHYAQSENIKKERDFLQSVLDSQQHIIFITDGDTIQSANKKFLDIFKSNKGFYSNLALLDNQTKADLLNIAKKHSSIDNPAKISLDDKDKYFVFDISMVEVKKYIVCMNDVSGYNKRIIDLKDKANNDQLTQCLNKSTITEYAKYWSEIKDYALIVLDIDKFKSINDNHGHYIGDCILKDLSSLVKNNISSKDLLGRFGGEEFILLLDISSLSLETVAQRLRKIIEKHEFIYESINLKITSSFGCIYCKKGTDFLDNFKKADEALYTAKKTGRNKVVIV